MEIKQVLNHFFESCDSEMPMQKSSIVQELIPKQKESWMD